MQIADPRQMTGTKRKLIMRDVAGTGPALALETVNDLALRYQLPQNEVRGLLVASGFRIPEPTVQPRTDQDPIKKAPPGRLAALVAAAKPPVPAEVISGILQGSIYKQLGEGDEAYVVTTRIAFLREREAIRAILKDGGLT
jgi:hypothetical protein